MSAAGQQGETPIPQKKRRWLWPLVIISLGLNLLFVGMVAGRIWFHGQGRPDGGRDRIFTGAIEELMKSLPDDKRARADELLKQHRSNLRQLKMKNRRARKAAEEALLMEPFDEKELAGVLARFRANNNERHQSMHSMMMGVINKSTLKERQQLLNNIHSGFRHRHRFGSGYSRRHNSPASLAE